MNNLGRTVYLLAVVLLFAGCTAGERHRATVTREWPASGIERVEVRGVNGDVRVEAVDGNVVSLVAEVNARGVTPTDDENRGYFRTEIDGNTLRIVQKKTPPVTLRFPFRVGGQLAVHFKLRVPRRVGVDLTTVNGRIATRGIAGNTRLKSVNGAIDADVDGQEGLRAQTVNGRIRATFQDDFRGARLTTVNGSIRAVLPSWASFRCDLSQVNGDFESSFPLSIHSHPGRRRVSGEVNGGHYELQISTVNGSVSVEQTDRREPPTVGAPATPPDPPELPGQPQPVS